MTNVFDGRGADAIINPGLPKGVGRAHILDLVERLVRPLGLNPTAILYLRAIARATAHHDWDDRTGRGPRCYMRQGDLAAAIGVRRGAANRIERRLEAAGLIAIRRLDNHHRAGRTGVIGETGLFLAPMIGRYAALREMRDRLDDAEQARKAAYGRASTARAELRAALRDAEPSTKAAALAVREAQAAFDASPGRLARLRSAEELHRVAGTLGAALLQLSEALDDQGAEDEPEEAGTREMIHACSTEETRHIQTTSNSETVICSRRPALATDDHRFDPAEAGSGCLQHKAAGARAPVNRKRRDARSADEDKKGSDDDLGDDDWARSDAKAIPVASLYRAASDAFRLYVDATSGGRARLADISFAAAMRRRELRFRDSAWSAAEDLGEVDRAVAVLILDRNQDHPVNPVRNPGGALLGMVRKARRGELRLAGSVIGILERRGSP